MPKVTADEQLVINPRLQRYIRVSETTCTIAPVSYHIYDEQPITKDFYKIPPSTIVVEALIMFNMIFSGIFY